MRVDPLVVAVPLVVVVAVTLVLACIPVVSVSSSVVMVVVVIPTTVIPETVMMVRSVMGASATFPRREQDRHTVGDAAGAVRVIVAVIEVVQQRQQRRGPEDERSGDPPVRHPRAPREPEPTRMGT